MSGTSAASVPATNKQSGIPIPKLSLREALMRAARRIWPTATDSYLAEFAHVGDRASRAWIALDAGMSLEAFDNLMASDHGLEFLRALMDRRTVVPDWWRDFEAAAELADVIRRQQSHRLHLQDQTTQDQKRRLLAKR